MGERNRKEDLNHPYSPGASHQAVYTKIDCPILVAMLENEWEKFNLLSIVTIVKGQIYPLVSKSFQLQYYYGYGFISVNIFNLEAGNILFTSK